jgi:6-phospho-3-hexuloisomerase
MGESATDRAETFRHAQEYIGRRVSESLKAIDPTLIERCIRILTEAPVTFVYGAGRSGIIGRAFAMRLVQAGITAYVIGESVTPIVRKGDAAFLLSGRGESYASIQTANIVRRQGAELIVVTARPSSKLAHAASLLIVLDLPEDAERKRFAPLGTLFESASLRFTDALIAALLHARGESEETMQSRHAIMV